MAFPDDRDRELQRVSSNVKSASEDLMDWLSQHKAARLAQDLGPLSIQDEFQLLSACRRAGNLFRSSKVPVAAAVYGPSQAGKSLFVGRVLRPSDPQFCPLGRDEVLGAPAYYANLNFDNDLNPQCGMAEATALVSRFTTKDRFDETVPPRYPVLVRGLSRSEWLRVLARGFRSECNFPDSEMWHEQQLEKLFVDASATLGADQADREWRMDLLDVYSYVQRHDPLRYRADESFLNGLIGRYPLTNDGYVQVAARLCWNSLPTLTSLFHRIWTFLTMTRKHGRDGILCHWAAVRFLLDSQCKPAHVSEHSKLWQKVSWSDLVDREEDGWYVLDYQPGMGPPKQDLATIQSAMLEMIVPVLPDRMNSEWRQVLEQIDFLDIPGMKGEGRSKEEGAKANAETHEAQMSIVKRGKVFYIFERFIEEMQIQTLLLLISGRPLEVRGALKEYVNRWGRTRYGKEVWPAKVRENPPAFFLGMTGIDEEFMMRSPSSDLYEIRLKTLASDTFNDSMNDFGGPGQPFTNVYPIRYPGTWDNDSEKRNVLGLEKWERAGQAFVTAELVKKHVSDPTVKWEAAMRDGDGGASLIAAAIRESASPLRKQDELTKSLTDVRVSLRQLANSWAVDPNANLDRDRRLNSANQVLSWILADEQLVYSRVSALQEALCFRHGDVMEVADLADINQSTRQRPEPLDRRLQRELPTFLMKWGKSVSPDRWCENSSHNSHDSDWLKPELFGTFCRYLAEYLCSAPVLNQLVTRLLSVISLQNRDEVARKNARRKFTRLILNDFVMNPGPDLTALAEIGDQKGDRDYGLMTSFVDRWLTRMPECLASAAGANVGIPPGNSELHGWLDDFRNQFPDE